MNAAAVASISNIVDGFHQMLFQGSSDRIRVTVERKQRLGIRSIRKTKIGKQVVDDLRKLTVAYECIRIQSVLFHARSKFTKKREVANPIHKH